LYYKYQDLIKIDCLRVYIKTQIVSASSRTAKKELLYAAAALFMMLNDYLLTAIEPT